MSAVHDMHETRQTATCESRVGTPSFILCWIAVLVPKSVNINLRHHCDLSNMFQGKERLGGIGVYGAIILN
jgi:hypothetical protein